MVRRCLRPLIYYNLTIFVVDARSLTHLLTLSIRHFKCGNRGRSNSDDTIGPNISDLVVYLVDMGYPTHHVLLRMKHLKCGNKYLWVVQPNNRWHNTIFESGLLGLLILINQLGKVMFTLNCILKLDHIFSECVTPSIEHLEHGNRSGHDSW